MLRSLLWWCLFWLTGLTSSLHAQGTLESLKRPYDAQAAKIRSETDAKFVSLNQSYIRNLEAIATQHKQSGNLEPLLVTRKELNRFRNSESVSERDVVAEPANVAGLQRGYISSNQALRSDRDNQVARLTKTYFDQLEQLKKALTMQDRITDALAVQREQEAVRSLLTVTAPAPNPNPVTSTRAHAVTPTVGSPTSPHAMKPPKGYFWLFFSDGATTPRGLSVFVGTQSGGKMLEYFTDSFGKLAFLASSGDEFKAMVVSDKYAVLELKNLKEGDSYQVRLAPHPPGQGIVEVRNKVASIPEIGRLNIELYSYQDFRSGTIRAENSRVRLSSQYSSSDSGTLYSLRDGTVARAQHGDAHYEFECLLLNGRWFLRYKKLPAVD